MSQFFEVLNTLQDPTVRFANDQGEPILALDKVGLEELSHSGLHHEPVFNGDDKLLWNMISSIDYEELRLGKHHMPQIQFVDINLILEGLSDEKAALVKKNCRCWGESWTKYHLPHNEIFHVEIDGLEIIQFLEGSTGRERTRILMQVFGQFTDKPVQIVEDRIAAAQHGRELSEEDKALLAEHRRIMQSVFENKS